MKLRIALLAATVLALPVAVKAQPISGLYVGAGAGYNILQQETAKTSLGTGGGKLKYNGGFVGLGSVGYGLGNGLRFEIEGDYRDNKVNKFSATGGPYAAGGDEEKIGAMVNALYDFNISPLVVPYVGAGVGYSWTYLRNLNAYTPAGTSVRAEDWAGSFAYQGIAGVGIPIPPIPGLAITAEYRFFGLGENTSFHGASYNAAGAVTAFGKVKTTDDYNHSFLVGLRYAFNQAPAAPPPAPAPMAAPAPAPARTYLVFFDWDKATLTDRARQIVAEAAQASTHVTYTKIQVNGYTDTSGTPKYNQGLSVRRAKTVAAELVKDGVPASAISISGFGETHLLVPTGPGVREPQNRRVEILIQ
jgi:outer membrane protein OmpA-like peptidoglycan-associated protein/outer membrane protein W